MDATFSVLLFENFGSCLSGGVEGFDGVRGGGGGRAEGEGAD